MLEKLGERAARKTKPVRYLNGQPVQEVFVDPATVTLAIAIISEVIKLIQYCRSKREDETTDESVEVAARIIQKPTRREVNALRRVLRRKMGWAAYWKDGGKTLKALLETGAETTKEEVAEAWSEV